MLKKWESERQTIWQSSALFFGKYRDFSSTLTCFLLNLSSGNKKFEQPWSLVH